ncbi:MAG: anhydro-N-acetylmuramic acid kinase [Gammaproteobacteria bacterium]|nr:anhydro-N-acetylmuramic acid kinase [Gammaproteobacteria bacterium]
MTLYIGLMSGTSVDGMDAALVDFAQGAPRLLDALCLPYDAAFRQQLRTLAVACEANINSIALLERRIAALSTEAVMQLLQRNSLSAADVRAIGSHGHTLRHKSQPDGFSWQLDDPSWVAEHTGICCIADFRRRDIAAGGQGAPLVPAFHQHCFGRNVQVLNIGGIANLSVLPTDSQPDSMMGFDTGPGNALLDEWCQQYFGCPRDDRGQLAANGNIINYLLEDWLSQPYFQLPPPKSTGRELFRLEHLGDLSHEDPQDVLSTLTELSVQSIALAIRQFGYSTGELLVCGGGVHNHYLMQRLQQVLPQLQVQSSAKRGIDPDWMEAMAFAWLAQRTLEGLSGNAPAVTGASGERILGGIYPA